MTGVTLRPATPADLPAVQQVKQRAFDALVTSMGQPAPPTPTAESLAHERRRLEHVMADENASSVVAVAEDGGIAGGAFACSREGVWVLSLLFVDPDRHSRGVGRRLLDATAPSDGPGLIAASDDPRAMRLYASHGFAPWPILRAFGPMRRAVAQPDGVVDGDPSDPLLARADIHGRGVARSVDLPLMMAPGSRLRVLPGGGYAISTPHKVVTVAALDDDAAATLLRDALSACEVGDEVEVYWIRGEQQWAVQVLLDAGFAIRSEGAICSRGVPLATSYLPNGAFL